MELHITHGSLVAGKLQEGGIPSRQIIPCDDRLSFGPVGRDVSLAKSRLAFWQQTYDLTKIGKGLAPQPDDFLRLSDRSTDLRTTDQITLWVGPSLDEGLHLLWLQAALRKLSVDLGKVSLIYVDINPNTKRQLPSLDVLPSEAIALVLPKRIKLMNSEWEHLERLWQAFTSSSPADFNHTILQTHAHGPGWIHPSLSLLSRRFPQKAIGLSHHIASFLRLLTRSPLLLHVLLGRFLTLHGDDRDLPGDLLLEAQLRELTAPMSQVALVELRDTGNSSIVEIAITAEGLEVVSGTKDHLDLNKIDRWIGGVHLTSDAREIWEFDPDAARLVKKKLL